MSESWYLGCDACDDEVDDGVNRGRTSLIELAENAWPLHLCLEAGFDLNGADIDINGHGLGYSASRQVVFAARHAHCNAFRVRCEYPSQAPVFPAVKGIAHQPCRLCADRGSIPCPECKPTERTRIETDAKMREKQRREAAP